MEKTTRRRVLGILGAGMLALTAARWLGSKKERQKTPQQVFTGPSDANQLLQKIKSAYYEPVTSITYTKDGKSITGRRTPQAARAMAAMMLHNPYAAFNEEQVEASKQRITPGWAGKLAGQAAKRTSGKLKQLAQKAVSAESKSRITSSQQKFSAILAKHKRFLDECDQQELLKTLGDMLADEDILVRLNAYKAAKILFYKQEVPNLVKKREAQLRKDEAQWRGKGGQINQDLKALIQLIDAAKDRQ